MDQDEPEEDGKDRKLLLSGQVYLGKNNYSHFSSRKYKKMDSMPRCSLSISASGNECAIGTAGGVWVINLNEIQDNSAELPEIHAQNLNDSAKSADLSSEKFSDSLIRDSKSDANFGDIREESHKIGRGISHNCSFLKFPQSSRYIDYWRDGSTFGNCGYCMKITNNIPRVSAESLEWWKTRNNKISKIKSSLNQSNISGLEASFLEPHYPTGRVELCDTSQAGPSCQLELDQVRTSWHPYMSYQSWMISAVQKSLTVFDVSRGTGSNSSIFDSGSSNGASVTAAAISNVAHQSSITDIGWSYFNPFVFTSIAIDGVVKVWDLRLKAGALGNQGDNSAARAGSNQGYSALSLKKPSFRLTHSDWNTEIGFKDQVSWNHGNEYILASSHCDNVKVWDLRKGNIPLQVISDIGNDTDDTAFVQSIDWSRAQDQELLVVSDIGNVKVWNIHDFSYPISDFNIAETGSDLALWDSLFTPNGHGVISSLRSTNFKLSLKALPKHSSSSSTTIKVGDFIHNEENIPGITNFKWRELGGFGHGKETSMESKYELITWSNDGILRMWSFVDGNQQREEVLDEESASFDVPEKADKEYVVPDALKVPDGVKLDLSKMGRLCLLDGLPDRFHNLKLLKNELFKYSKILCHRYRILSAGVEITNGRSLGLSDNITDIYEPRFAIVRLFSVNHPSTKQLLQLLCIFDLFNKPAWPKMYLGAYIYPEKTKEASKLTFVKIPLDQFSLDEVYKIKLSIMKQDFSSYLEKVVQIWLTGLPKNFIDSKFHDPVARNINANWLSSRPNPWESRSESGGQSKSARVMNESDLKILEDRVPFPCLCGARFSGTGQLIYFMKKTPSIILERNNGIIPRSLRLYRGSLGSESSDKESYDWIMKRKFSSDIRSSFLLSSNSDESYNFSDGIFPRSFMTKDPDFIHEVKIINIDSCIFQSNYRADLYSLNSENGRLICSENQIIAKKFGRWDSWYAWRIAELLLSMSFRKKYFEKSSCSGAIFSKDPFGINLIRAIFEYFELIGDLQTLALLSCVFETQTLMGNFLAASDESDIASTDTIILERKSEDYETSSISTDLNSSSSSLKAISAAVKSAISSFPSGSSPPTNKPMKTNSSFDPENSDRVKFNESIVNTNSISSADKLAVSEDLFENATPVIPTRKIRKSFQTREPTQKR